MIVLNVNDIEKSFGERTLFAGVTFALSQDAKAGLAGVNGAGKTTLFRIIAGQIEADKGSVHVARDYNLGYLEQHAVKDASLSLFDYTVSVFSHLSQMEMQMEEVNERLEKEGGSDKLIERQHALNEAFMHGGGLTYLSRTRSALLGMGFCQEDFSLPMGALSGGQASKAQMARLLLSNADILLLDEPTNHLDVRSTEWLEGYLSSYPGAFIVISHDRYFLDRVTNETLELENGKLKAFEGNYTKYLAFKKEAREIERRHYDSAMREVKRLDNMITELRRWNKEKSIKTAESKQKMRDKLASATVKPERGPEAIRFRLSAKERGGNEVLRVRHLSKAYGGELFKDLSFDLQRGERLFLFGPNGCGKTTLMKIVAGVLKPDGGYVEYGAGVSLGYYEQTQSSLDFNGTVLSEVWNAYPALTQTQVRASLAAFLFGKDDIEKRIGDISGGERARVELLKLMLSKANALLLDEPTNHLDASSREALESALSDYEGSMLVISHDRYLINRLATRILEFTEEGIREYLGNYDGMAAQKAAEPQIPALERKKEEAPPVKNGYGLKRQADKRKRAADIRNIESKISQAEDEIAKLQQEMASGEVASDYEKLMEAGKALEDKKAELDGLLALWGELSEDAEE